MERIKTYLILIPNYPFLIIYSLYIVYLIIKQSGYTEFVMMDKKEFLTKERKMYIRNNYPDWLYNSIALSFYGFLLIKLINQ